MHVLNRNLVTVIFKYCMQLCLGEGESPYVLNCNLLTMDIRSLISIDVVHYSLQKTVANWQVE